MNLAYGPWQSAAWWQLFLSGAKHAAAVLTENSQFVLRLWPRVLNDRGIVGAMGDAEVSGSIARRAFVDGLGSEDQLNIKSVRVKPQNWMSWQESWVGWDTWLHTRVAVIGWTCIQKGIISTVEDMFGGAKIKNFEDASGAATGMSKAAAVRQAKSKLENSKQKHQHHIGAAIKVICDPDVANGARLLALATRAEHLEFKRVAHQL